MTVKLKNTIFISGVHQLDGTTLMLGADKEAELVNRGVAIYVGDNPAVGELFPPNVNLRSSNISAFGIGNTGGGSGSLTTSIVGYTWQQIVIARSKPYAVQIEYCNNTAVSYTVDKTTITPSDTFAVVSPFDPTGGVTPVNVLFGGAAAAVVQAGTPGSVIGSVLSDWTAITPLDRVDVPNAFSLEHIRSYIANAGATLYPYETIDQYTSYPGNVARGRVWKNGFIVGDKIATPTGFTNNSGVMLTMNVRYKEVARCITLASIGDSITYGNLGGSGSGPGAQLNTWVDKCLDSINPTALSYGTQFSHINCGIASTSFTQFIGRVQDVLTKHNPSVMLVPIFTPNFPPTTQALMDAQNNLLLEAIAKIQANGTIPILWTGIPQNIMTASVDALRIANNNFWRGIAAAGGYVLADFDAAVTGGMVSGVTQYKSPHSIDGTHPSALGQDAMAAVLRSILLGL